MYCFSSIGGFCSARAIGERPHLRWTLFKGRISQSQRKVIIHRTTCGLKRTVYTRVMRIIAGSSPKFKHNRERNSALNWSAFIGSRNEGHLFD